MMNLYLLKIQLIFHLFYQKLNQAFLDNLYGNTPRHCKLECDSRLSWKVILNRVNEDFYFQEGWDVFVRENSLQFGHFITFHYATLSTFYVTIFATSGIPKSLCCEDESYESVEESEGSEDVYTHSSGTRSRRKRSVEDSSAKASFNLIIKSLYINKARLHIPIEETNVVSCIY